MRADLHKSILNSFASYRSFLIMKTHFSGHVIYILSKSKVISSSIRANYSAGY